MGRKGISSNMVPLFSDCKVLKRTVIDGLSGSISGTCQRNDHTSSMPAKPGSPRGFLISPKG